MPIVCDRDICCDVNETIRREWIVTNRLGGYAAGTIAGVLTRSQHGLLVAPVEGEPVPQVLLAKIDEEVVFDERVYYLGTNEYRDGTLNPSGFVHLESFRLEDGLPIFTYRLGGVNGIKLEKRIWLAADQQTTYLQYRVLRTANSDEGFNYRRGPTGALPGGYGRYYEQVERQQRSITLTLLPFTARRPYNSTRQAAGYDPFYVHIIGKGEQQEYIPLMGSPPVAGVGCSVAYGKNLLPLHIIASGHQESNVTCLPTGVWYWNFLHRLDTPFGRPAIDDLYLPVVFKATLWPAEESVLTLIASTEPLSALSGDRSHIYHAYTQRQEQQRQFQHSILHPHSYFGEAGEAMQAQHLRVIQLPDREDAYGEGEEFLQHLLQATSHFVSNTFSRDGEGWWSKQHEQQPLVRTSLFQMEQHTRDLLIALPGLLLITERRQEARQLFLRLARACRGGLLPEQIPLPGQALPESEYASADLVPWYCYALDHYLRISQDTDLLEELYPILLDCLHYYIQGTYHGIHVDASDGLLSIPDTNAACTWMNARLHGRAITPRSGKPVEVNALWHHMLTLLQKWNQQLDRYSTWSGHNNYYEDLLMRCRKNFTRRFWYSDGGYLYDVIDGMVSQDSTLRPNQLLALTLQPTLFSSSQHLSAIETMSRHLLTPYGLRTLAPYEPGYRGHAGKYEADQALALHQGSVWGWLIGPYIEALLHLSTLPDYHTGYRRVEADLAARWENVLTLITPFHQRLQQGLLGCVEGIFDGDAPHHPAVYAGSASTTGELLRIYSLLARTRSLHVGQLTYR